MIKKAKRPTDVTDVRKDGRRERAKKETRAASKNHPLTLLQRIDKYKDLI